MAEIKVKCPKCNNYFYMQDYDRTACRHCGFVITGPKYTSSGGGCFITTACVKSKGLPDDCRELEVMRSFRDVFVLSMPAGNKLIQDYYRDAPIIVMKIDTLENAHRVYEEIYEVVLKMEKLINSGDADAAFALGYRKFNQLKGKYL